MELALVSLRTPIAASSRVLNPQQSSNTAIQSSRSSRAMPKGKSTSWYVPVIFIKEVFPRNRELICGVTIIIIIVI